MKIGFHTNFNRDGQREFDGPIKEGKGVDFVLCHYDPSDKNTVSEEAARVKKAIERFKELGVEFILNFEHQNFIENTKSADGFDYANHADGTHRLSLPDEFLAALKGVPHFLGIMYDELEHVIINRNLSIALATKFKKYLPTFPCEKNTTVRAQGEKLSKQIKDYADDIVKRGGKSLSGEHVMPVLFHTFARNGVIPNFKSQKESFSNVQFACAAGAALQYGTELWNCVDMWNRNTFPGHTASELAANLRFAYNAGVDRVYVESSSVFYDGDTETDIGKAFRAFADEYKGKERDYGIKDFKPEIGIIHYDDSFWGQGRIKYLWRNMLLGNPALKVKKENREWIYAFNLISHGKTGNGGICADRIELRSLLPHRSFAPMNNAAVFDDRVTKDKLESLKLCFLTGVHIEEATLRAVSELVRENGLTVVTPERYAHGLKKGEHPDGKGKWIVTNNFRSPLLKKRLSPMLGKKDEMVYRFGDKEIRMKITEKGDNFILL